MGVLRLVFGLAVTGFGIVEFGLGDLAMHGTFHPVPPTLLHRRPHPQKPPHTISTKPLHLPTPKPTHHPPPTTHQPTNQNPHHNLHHHNHHDHDTQLACSFAADRASRSRTLCSPAAIITNLNVRRVLGGKGGGVQFGGEGGLEEGPGVAKFPNSKSTILNPMIEHPNPKLTTTITYTSQPQNLNPEAANQHTQAHTHTYTHVAWWWVIVVDNLSLRAAANTSSQHPEAATKVCDHACTRSASIVISSPSGSWNSVSGWSCYMGVQSTVDTNFGQQQKQSCININTHAASFVFGNKQWKYKTTHVFNTSVIRNPCTSIGY